MDECIVCVNDQSETIESEMIEVKTVKWELIEEIEQQYGCKSECNDEPTAIYQQSTNFNIEIANKLDSLLSMSSCLKLKTSAIIAKNDVILSSGYNEAITNWSCEDYWIDQYSKSNHELTFEEFIATDDFKKQHKDWSLVNEIHAECRAIFNAVKSGWKLMDAELYTFYSPCANCAKTIMFFGIKVVYYKHVYKHGQNAFKYLTDAGVKLYRY